MTRADHLRIEREDGELLVLDGRGLAKAFFAGDPSALAGGYDSLAGSGDPDRIVIEDVIAMNTTMRARSGHRSWEPVISGDQSWLAEVPRDLDLIETGNGEWEDLGADAFVSAAIGGCIHRGIGLAGATKVLHLKRPRLIPILDSLVAQMMGVAIPEEPNLDARVAIGARLCSALRTEGRRNIESLRLIQSALADDGVDRSLVRILDAVLWFSHPAARVPGIARSISVEMATRSEV